MKIRPFKALRPVRDKVHLVATRPFYTYKKNVLKAKMQSNPFSFLHIINPDFDILGTDSNPLDRETKQKLVRDKYREFIQDGVLVQDSQPSLYIYRQSRNGHEYTGVIAATSVESYNKGKIKKHEATITAREEMFTNYLDTVGYNAEPVLLCHNPSEKLDEILREITSKRPEYEFTTTDHLKHELWIASPIKSQIITNIFDEMKVVYIADGHHRCASSSALNKRRNNNGDSNDNYFLSYLIDETKLKIYEYNRLVKNKKNIQLDEFLVALGINFNVERLNEKRNPIKEHEIVMIFGDNWYSLICNEEIINENHPVKSLDAEILTEFVLSPILGIKDLKTDNNISFISGTEDIESLRKKMKKGKMDIAFLLFPATMAQVKKVADNEMIMPPKSTWVEPKMRSGLTIYNINE
jgi:uncharacterized protein (DUF1015 family)